MSVLEVLGTETLTITEVCDAIAATDATGERTAVRNEISALVAAGTLARTDNRFIHLKGTP